MDDQMAKPTDAQEQDIADLKDIFANLEDYERTLSELKFFCPTIEALRGRLTESAEILLNCLELKNTLDQKYERLQLYANIKLDLDRSDKINFSRRAELLGVIADIRKRTLFIHLEIQQIPEDAFERLLNDPLLQHWRNFLIDVRSFRLNALSEPEETGLAQSGHNVRSGYQDIAREILYDMQSSHGKLEHHESGLTAVLSLLAKNIVDEFGKRKYRLDTPEGSSALAGFLFQTRTPYDLYNRLVTEFYEALPYRHKFADLRQSFRDLERRCGTSAGHTKVSLTEAKRLTLRALAPLGNEYVAMQSQVLESHHIDVYERPGKRQGAKTYLIYDCPEYFMTNYEYSIAGVYRMIHELGHMAANSLSRSSQTYQDQRYWNPFTGERDWSILTEIPAIINELLLTDHLRSSRSSHATRTYLTLQELNRLERAFWETVSAVFIQKVYEHAERHGQLNLDVIREIYGNVVDRPYYGPKSAADQKPSVYLLSLSRTYDSHLFSYHFYPFGLSASIALFEEVKRNGPARYLDFLKSWASKPPLDLLQAAGLDIQSPDFFKRTVQLFADRLKDLEENLRLWEGDLLISEAGQLPVQYFQTSVLRKQKETKIGKNMA